jgi:RNA polymerase sigma-70 factor (ECF subfamily)
MHTITNKNNSDAPNTSSLLEKIRNRDEEAFVLLYDFYSPALFAVIRELIPEEKSAEEVLQTTLLKVWTQQENYTEGKTEFKCWLLNLGRKEAFNKLNASVASKVSGPLGQLMGSNTIPMQQFLAQLDTFEKTVFSLMFYRKLNCDEIAALLKIPVQAINARLAAAQKKLAGLYPPTA